MRKILLATPVKGNLPPRFVSSMVQLLCKGIPDVAFDIAFLEGEPINFARNSLANHAITSGFDEIIWWDADLKPTLEQLTKLISHRMPIVCALYPKRDVVTQFHVQSTKDGTQISGMQEADLTAIGFSKMTVEALKQIADFHPYLSCSFQNNGQAALKHHNLFQMEIKGPNSAEGKLERIKKVVGEAHGPSGDVDAAAIEEILNDSDYSENRLYGEDYSFCMLARAAGVKLMVDTSLCITHSGETDFHIATETLKKELAQEWRKEK